MQIERLVVEWDAGATSLGRGMRQATSEIDGAAQKIGRSTDRAALNVNKLGNAFGNLAQQTLGYSPTIGRLGDILGDFFVGGVITAGVLAGLAIMGKAWEAATAPIKEYEKAVTDTAKALDQLARRRAVGGQLPAHEQMVTARTELAPLRRRQAELQAAVGAGALGGLGNVFGGLDKATRELASVNAQIAEWERGLAEANKEILKGIPAIEGITVSIERVKTQALSEMQGPGLNANAEAARAAFLASKTDDRPEWVKKLPRTLTATTAATTAVSDGAIEAAESYDELTGSVLNFASIGSSAIADFALGAEVSIKGFVTAALAEVSRLLSRLLAVTALKAIFAGSTGGIGGAVLSAIEGRASGGPVTGGRPYLVGERGPELIVPAASGYVVPNGGGGGISAADFLAALGPLPRPQTPREVSRDAWWREAIVHLDRQRRERS